MSKLTIYKKVNLTEDTNNIEPKYVKKLFMGNEPDNELVQYYIVPDTAAQEDKKSNVVLSNYDELVWSNKKKRLTARKIRDLGIKTFPTYGAIGFFTYQYTPRSLILCPVNNHSRKFEAPTLEMIDNGDTLTFNIGAPEDITYECYRIILRCNEFAYEYITYDLSVTVPIPEVKGTYDIYCIGYENEGEAVSDDSNFLTLTVTEGLDTFAPKPEMSYYTKEQIDAMIGEIGTLLDVINGEVIE